MSNIHIFFRSILMQILHKRRGDSFAETFTQTRRQQEREQQPVAGGKGTENNSESGHHHAETHGFPFAETSGDDSADHQGNHHGDAAQQVKHSAGTHAALIQRKIQIFAHGDQHNRDGQRTDGICDERGISGKIVTAEVQTPEFHENKLLFNFFSESE